MRGTKEESYPIPEGIKLVANEGEGVRILGALFGNNC